MSSVAEKTDPKLWDRIKAAVTEGDKGGEPGRWSARKAQIATREYQAQGGGYRGRKPSDNHLQQWQDEEWGTKSGRKSGETGERYLPKAAREHLTAAEYERSSRKKRADTRRGKPVSPQPPDIAEKTARDRATGKGRSGGRTKAELMETARAKNVPGRSKMTKAQLEKAVA